MRKPRKEPEPPEEALAKMRTRWLRWLGQVCREDRSGWVELLSSNYLTFPAKILGEQYKPMLWNTNKAEVVSQYREAIGRADMEQLRILDNLYCEKAMEKRLGIK